MTHIRIRNFGLGDEWSQLEEDQSRQKLLKKYQVKVIDFLSLGYKERYLINKKRLNFAEAQGCQDFTVLVKQRVVNFLLAAYTSFDNAGVWRESTPMSEPERFWNYGPLAYYKYKLLLL